MIQGPEVLVFTVVSKVVSMFGIKSRRFKVQALGVSSSLVEGPCFAGLWSSGGCGVFCWGS